MNHLLDNPVWNALSTGNKNLAEGNDQVKCFPREIAPFTGFKEINKSSFESLAEIITPGRTIAIVTPAAIEMPASWKTSSQMNVFQMVSEKDGLRNAGPNEILPLDLRYVPQMLAITKLTNPGPFHSRTIELGNYYGIFKDNQLVAMAGQRMHAGEFLEISAVCTLPGYNGHGYATSLMTHMANIIRNQSCVPFLHVLTENIKAVSLYNSLGFVIRRQMIVNVVQKKSE